MRARIKKWAAYSGLAGQAAGIVTWLVAWVLHHGHVGAWIGAAEAELGFVLVWVGALLHRSVKLPRDSWLIITTAIILISPPAGLTTGAMTTWWIGLVVCTGLLLAGVVLGKYIVIDDESDAQNV